MSKSLEYYTSIEEAHQLMRKKSGRNLLSLEIFKKKCIFDLLTDNNGMLFC